NLVLGEIGGQRIGHGRQIQTDLLLHERSEAGLVAPVEGDVVQTPAPPLVPLHLGRAQRCTHSASSSSRPPGARISSYCLSYWIFTRSRMRAEKSTADSPSSAIIGSPNTTPTAGRPGVGQLRPLGIAS